MATNKKKQEEPSEAQPEYRLVSFEVQDVKRVKVVKCKVDKTKHTLIIGGDNEQGKSSAIDGLFYALAGAKALPPEPVRVGTQKARVKLDLLEIIVELTITKEGSRTLKITKADGTTVTRTQELLDSITGKLAFDPVAFTRYEPAKQYEMVRELVKLDFTDLETRYDRAYNERAKMNSNIEEQEARLGSLEGPFGGVPEKEEEAAELQRQFTEATTAQVKYNELANKLEKAAADLEKARLLVTQMERVVKELQDVAKNTPKPADTSALLKRLQSMQDTNKKVRANIDRKRIDTVLGQLRDERTDLETELDAVKKEKLDRLKKAKFPVEGLGFEVDDKGKGRLVLKNVPFEQASSAEKLRAAFAIVQAMNPVLKLCFVRDGSLLDKHSLEVVEQMAAAWDGLVVLERVGKGDECSLIIEDGLVLQN